MKNILQPLKTIILALLLAFSVSYVFAAWSGPTATPPDGNTDAPVNVGIVDQIKDAGLGVNALSVFGRGLFSGEVQIGSTGLVCDSNVYGTIKYNEDSNCLQLCTDPDWQDVSCAAGPCGGIDSVTYEGGPNDGAYSTVSIGTQCWLGENLNVGVMVTSYGAMNNDGTTEKYCYGNTLTGCDNNYGGLYRWDEAMGYVTTPGVQGICPSGWHIPTNAEFKILVESQATLGCESSHSWQCSPAGDRLKYSSTPGTDSEGICVNNDNCGLSAFGALLTGYHDNDGSFYSRDSSTRFWTSTVSGGSAWVRLLNWGAVREEVYAYATNQERGIPVRCLKN
jgi:uncharacterized protein (TIGR02145 family)